MHRQHLCLHTLPTKQWHSVVQSVYIVVPYPPSFWFSVQQSDHEVYYSPGQQWAESWPWAKLTSYILSIQKPLDHEYGNAAHGLQSKARGEHPQCHCCKALF